MLAQISGVWITGIISQLTNFPPDLMIEKWIFDRFLELRAYQLVSLQRQWNEAIRSWTSALGR